MGSLEGHILPGTFIVCFGIWWTYALFDRYFKALVDSILTKKRLRFESTASFSKYESWVKISMSIMGIVAEFYTALDNQLNFIHIGNSQHITMYTFFLINGLIDVLMHYGFPLPNGSDYLSLCLAVAIEALLFCFHLHGRTGLDIHVHTLLIISIICSLMATLIEWKYRHNMLSGLMRSTFTLLQGFWFYTVAFILYLPFWSGPLEDSHKKMMFFTSLFCWEIAAIIILMIFIGFLFHLKYRTVLTTKQFLSNNLLNSYSAMDFRSLINEQEQQLTQTKSAESTSNCKYTTINTSDEEI